VPFLLGAELVVNLRLRAVVSQFLTRDLIPESGRAAFDAALASAIRLRNSIWFEVLLLGAIYAVGTSLRWRTHMVLGVDGWYGTTTGGTWQPSRAGWWLILVSLPLFQFLLLRWYYRLFIWARFMWQVSRIELKLMPAHPDRMGGLGFLAQTGYIFSLL